MLVLSRKANECVVIDGRIIIRVVRVDGDVVKLGIEAPADVPVHRQEVYEEIQRNNREALTNKRPAVPRLPRKSKAPIEEKRTAQPVKVPDMDVNKITSNLK